MTHVIHEHKMNKPLLGVGSFAFRYNVGFKGFNPPQPMNVYDFLKRAHQMGFQDVQLCENLHYSNLSDNELARLGELARELNLIIELGMRGLTEENISRHIDIAEILSSHFLRIVIGEDTRTSSESVNASQKNAVQILHGVLPRCNRLKLTVGIENHFDLDSDSLIEIVKEIEDDHVGLILDTTNCLGFIEEPEILVQKFLPYLCSIHLKDYIVQKVEAGYFITGTPLGEGLLNVGKLLRVALTNKPFISLIIELTVRRNESQKMERILEWEYSAIKRSRDHLIKSLEKLKKER